MIRALNLVSKCNFVFYCHPDIHGRNSALFTLIKDEHFHNCKRSYWSPNSEFQLLFVPFLPANGKANLSMYSYTLNTYCSRSFGGHSVHLFKNGLFLQNGRL